MTDRDSGNRERIVGLLSGVDRRLRRNEALDRLSVGLWGLVGMLVVIKLTGAWSNPWLRFSLLALYGVAFTAVVLWRYAQERSLPRSAAVADRQADLKDALKSSLFFLDADERSAWMDLQIERSAEAAGSLDAETLAPTLVPSRLYYALGTGALVFTLFAWNPGWLRELERADFLTTARHGEQDMIEELLDDGEAVLPEEEKLEELSEALERLRQRDLELTESLSELDEAQQALAASRADLERLEMDLEELGRELETAPALADLAEALKSQDGMEAAERLRELAERLANAESSEELQALLEALQNANVQNEDLAEMMENLEAAAGEMTADDLAKMADALEAMAEQMESMGQQMAAQQDMDQMGQEQLEASLGQQQAGQQQQTGEQQQQASGQAMQSQAGMMSNQMQMAQMQGDPSSAVPVDAGPAGDTTGPGGGGDEEVIGEATTLDVQLEMEMLSPEENAEPVPEEIFERLSREEQSTLNYESVRGLSRYAEESAIDRQSVPWPYRSLVKRYFMSILNNAESTPQP